MLEAGKIRLAVPIRGHETVEVIPKEERPLVPHPKTDRWRAMLAPMPGADNRAYARLIAANRMLARCMELGAEPLLIDARTRELEAAFDHLHDVLQRSPEARAAIPPTEWSDIDRPELEPGQQRIDPTRLTGRAPEPEDAPVDACVWLDADRLLVQRAGVVSVLDVRTRERSKPISAGARLVGVRGEHALFVGDCPRWYSPEDEALLGLAVLHVGRGEWLRRVPDVMTMVTVEKEQPEDAWLYDSRTGQSAAFAEPLGDRPRELARTPDMRFIWVGSSARAGCVYEVETARAWLDVHAMGLWEQRDVPVVGGDGGRYDFWAAAIARTDVWHVLDDSGNVVRDGKVLFRIGWQANGAAFDPTGERLALIGERITIVRVDAPHELRIY